MSGGRAGRAQPCGRVHERCRPPTRGSEISSAPVAGLGSIARLLGLVYNRTYMVTEWDPQKARLNARKHGVQFADAVAVLEDEHALTMRDPSVHEEERRITLGLDALGRLLVVVYTWRGERVRLISGRKATASERRRYEESHEARI